MRVGVICLLGLVGCSSSTNDAKNPAPDAGDAGTHSDSAFDSAGDVVADAPSSDAPSAECQALTEKLGAALEQARVSIGSEDAALAVSKPGCTTALVRGNSGLSPEHLFRIGSISKTYTAGVILRQLSAKLLTLDDLAEKWVPGLPNGTSITLKHLLTHQSGLYNYTDDPGFLTQLTKTWTPDELIQISVSHGADFAPGSQWEYSNTNFIVLGVIAEKVGGKPLVDQIHAELLTPLALEHSFLAGSETLPDPLAPSYFANGSDATYSIDPSAAWSAGAMAATVADVDRWITALATGKVHDATTQAAMLDAVATDSPVLKYGLGIELLDASVTGGAGQGIGHDGHINGYDSQAFHFVESDTTLISVVNKEGTSANDITLAALGVLFP